MMKRVATLLQSAHSPFIALLFAVVLVLAGCSAASISGPDLAPSESLQYEAPSNAPSAPHNEDSGAFKNGGGGTTIGGVEHNPG